MRSHRLPPLAPSSLWVSYWHRARVQPPRVPRDWGARGVSAGPDAAALAPPDNTAAVHTQRVGFNRQEQDIYLLPILVVDSGPPALSSTGTLTIRVCGCDSAGAIQSCNSTAYAMTATLSPGALIALLVCILILVGESPGPFPPRPALHLLPPAGLGSPAGHSCHAAPSTCQHLGCC